MSLNQQTITLDKYSQKDKVLPIRELIVKIVKINTNKNNIDVAITSERTRKTVIITESIEKNIFRLGQFFKQQRRKRDLDNTRTNLAQWEHILEIDHLDSFKADIHYSNDAKWHKTCTIVFHE